MAKNSSGLQQPQGSVYGYQLAQSGLYDSSFLKHGQIQATYPSNNDLKDVEPETPHRPVKLKKKK